VSRISLVALLLLFVGGWNTQAFAAWSGSGQGTLKNGTWYVLYEDGETSINNWSAASPKTLSGPGAKLSFTAKRQASATGDLKVTDNLGNQYYKGNPGHKTKTFLGIESQTDYDNYGTYDVNLSASSLTFENTGTLHQYVKNIKVTMAQYIEAPSVTSLDFGSGKVDDANTTKTFTIAWCNVPAMSHSVTGTGKDKVSVSITNNAEYGKYNTATVIVTYNRNTASTLNATLTISDTYGSYSKNISLKGSTSKYDQTLSWSGDVIENMLKGTTQNCAATATSGLAVSYTSSNSDILSVDANGKLTAKAVGGPVTITASQAGNYKYNVATSLTRTFYVKTKDTPIFTPNGFAAGETCHLKVGDKVTLDVSYVSAGLAGDFKATATGTNVLGFTLLLLRLLTPELLRRPLPKRKTVIYSEQHNRILSPLPSIRHLSPARRII